jgi:uncharacterized membrane protein
MINFLQRESNSVSATRLLIEELGIKVSASSIKKHIDNHPDYPSILSISDSLRHWKIDNFVIKADKQKLHDLPVPFIAHLKNKGGLFSTVTEVNNKTVVYQNGNKAKKEIISVNDFLQEWSGVTLIAEAGEDSGEKNYRQSRKKEILRSLKLPLVISIILAFTALSIFYQSYNSLIFTPYTLLLCLKLAGCAVAALLIVYEIDKANPLLKQICGIGEQTNCAAVLSSKHSKIFGISWSEVGCFYFAGGFISFLVAGSQVANVLQVLVWLNVLALPYTIFSVYYQSKIAKQWCPMCLAVQATLIGEFITAIALNLHSTSSLKITNLTFLSLLPSFILPPVIWFLLKPLLSQNEEAKRKKRELLKFKYDQRIFDTLLLKQKEITADATGLGITIGNPEASNTIIKVCNPYCGPCSKAHPEIEELLEENDNLKVQVLFTATNNETDIKSLPVKHLLAIAEKQNERLTKQALDDWYLAKKKDYELFAAKYPMNGELKMQNAKVEAMRNWCDEVGIAFTPTFFINGYKLPDIYNVGDLQYFLHPSR